MKLDHVIETLRNAIPECIVAGVVDLPTGMLLAVRTERERTGNDLDLLAASAEMLFQGSRLPQLAQVFSDGDSTVQDVVLVSDGAVFVFQRCRQRPTVAVVTVSRASSNLGMTLARARQTFADVETSLLTALAS
jgi:hypothetical protein